MVRGLGQLRKWKPMEGRRSLYRLVALDGSPHDVLDAPYESLEAALSAAQIWSHGQGMNCPLGQRDIGVEVLTQVGSWRTVRYPMDSSRPGVAC